MKLAELDEPRDVELVRRMADGDEEALGQFYQRYRPLVHSLARRFLHNDSDAEEVTHDVLWDTWKKAHQYDESRGQVAAWLTNRTRSRAIDRLRRLEHRRRLAETMRPEEVNCVTLTTDADPAVVIDVRRRVRAALGELPRAQRTALQLAYFEGMSQSEIATATRAPLGTVKSRIRAGLSSLGDSLSEHL